MQHFCFMQIPVDVDYLRVDYLHILLFLFENDQISALFVEKFQHENIFRNINKSEGKLARVPIIYLKECRYLEQRKDAGTSLIV